MSDIGGGDRVKPDWRKRLEALRRQRAEPADPTALLRQAGSAADSQMRALALKELLATPEFTSRIRAICRNVDIRSGRPRGAGIPDFEDLVTVVMTRCYQAIERGPKRFGQDPDPWRGFDQFIRQTGRNLLINQLPHNHFIESKRAAAALTAMLPLLSEAYEVTERGVVPDWLVAVSNDPAAVKEVLTPMLSDFIPNSTLPPSAVAADRARLILRAAAREYERQRKETG